MPPPLRRGKVPDGAGELEHLVQRVGAEEHPSVEDKGLGQQPGKAGGGEPALGGVNGTAESPTTDSP